MCCCSIFAHNARRDTSSFPDIIPLPSPEVVDKEWDVISNLPPLMRAIYKS